MSTQIIDNKWINVFKGAIKKTSKEILLISPFIQEKLIKELFDKVKVPIKLITRYNLNDFNEGVSSLNALRILLDKGAKIKGIRHLHSKLYVFDAVQAIIGSTNLTHAALYLNQEFGIVSTDVTIIKSSNEYFDKLWKSVGSILKESDINKWQEEIDKANKGKKGPNKNKKLSDYGTDVGFEEHTSEIQRSFDTSKQWFIKFFGSSNTRADRENTVIDEINRSDCHRVCTYPKGRRPREVKDNSIMFISRLVDKPNDILIYGRAIGKEHNEETDDASNSEFASRPWKKDWPHYIRIKNPEFIDGILSDGISLNHLMNKFEAESFLTTLKHKLLNKGNTNPRRTYSQKPHVSLTPQAAIWLNEQLEEAFKKHGKLKFNDLKHIT